MQPLDNKPATSPRRKPLTQDQKAQAYHLYTQDQQVWTMKALAHLYNTSVSVIHRTIHQEAYKRGIRL